ncbi:MAG: cellulase family glycosylhydrolase [Candidatus Hydrogenedentales bacterium]|jgi:hypothetical protein
MSKAASAIIMLSLFCICERAYATRLSVNADGVLLKDGHKYRAFGVNDYYVFLAHLLHPTVRDYEQRFADLSDHGIPFVRFNVSGWSPYDFSLYVTNKDTFFSRLDDVVRCAEQEGIGLIPSLNWSYWTIPDTVHEHISAYGDSNSETIAFLRQYVRDIVTRYKNSPAIWAWEFGNEYNLPADLSCLSNWQDVLPPTHTSLGMPATRTIEDIPSTADLLVAFQAFESVVHEIDPLALITTGNSIPRTFAEDLRAGNAWGNLDTIEDYRANLLLTNPTGYELVSIHLYPLEVQAPVYRFESGHLTTYDEIASVTINTCRNAGKALFIGEYGAAPEDIAEGTAEAAAEHLNAMLDAFTTRKVSLAAYWVYGWYAGDPNPEQANRIATFENERSWILDRIAAENREIRKDTDFDGLRDIDEDANENDLVDPGETAPNNPDTDGDGVSDGTEVMVGSDPLDPEDTPQLPGVGMRGLAALTLILAGIYLGQQEVFARGTKGNTG